MSGKKPPSTSKSSPGNGRATKRAGSSTPHSRESSAAKSSSSKGGSGGYKMSFNEMLSYGHKPGDSDWGEMKRAYEKAFTDYDRQYESSLKHGASGTPASRGSSSAKSSSSKGGSGGYKMSYNEMLSYGHKPGDSDWGEMKQAYEKAFTDYDRQYESSWNDGR